MLPSHLCFFVPAYRLGRFTSAPRSLPFPAAFPLTLPFSLLRFSFSLSRSFCIYLFRLESRNEDRRLVHVRQLGAPATVQILPLSATFYPRRDRGSSARPTIVVLFTIAWLAEKSRYANARVQGIYTCERTKIREPLTNTPARSVTFPATVNSLDAQMQTTELETVTRRFQGKPENSVSRAAVQFLNCRRFSYYTDGGRRTCGEEEYR